MSLAILLTKILNGSTKAPIVAIKKPEKKKNENLKKKNLNLYKKKQKKKYGFETEIIPAR
jgi:hypothetical protein